MRICHSFWTKPIIENGEYSADKKALIANIWLYTLSFIHARKFDTKLILHTDKIGSNILNFLPYDEIILSLDNLNVSPLFWAAGKLKSLSTEPPCSIHIDGDVFLKNINLKDKLNPSNSDLLIQHIEPLNDIYENHIKVFEYFFNKVPDKIYKPSTKYKPFNCGIIGFNNSILKKKYIESYFSAINYYSANKLFMKFASENKKQFIPDLILEQLSLGYFARNNKYSVQKILNNPDNIYNEAIEIGYTHLIGQSKFELINQVKERVFEIDPDLYFQAEKRVNEFLF